jgi:hypothetical protein
VAVGEEGAIGRHEPPSLAELVILVLSQQLGEASDVKHDGRRVEVGKCREITTRKSEAPIIKGGYLLISSVSYFPRKEARRNVPKVDLGFDVLASKEAHEITIAVVRASVLTVTVLSFHMPDIH